MSFSLYSTWGGLCGCKTNFSLSLVPLSLIISQLVNHIQFIVQISLLQWKFIAGDENVVTQSFDKIAIFVQIWIWSCEMKKQIIANKQGTKLNFWYEMRQKMIEFLRSINSQMFAHASFSIHKIRRNYSDYLWRSYLCIHAD